MEKVDRVPGKQRIAGEQPDVGVQAGGLYMIVAGADVNVGAQPATFLANDQSNLAVSFETGHAKRDMGTRSFQFGSPMEVTLLVEAGLDSITQATCLPVSAARISDRTNGVSSPMRYAVILIETVCGSSAAIRMKCSMLPSKLS